MPVNEGWQANRAGAVLDVAVHGDLAYVAGLGMQLMNVSSCQCSADTTGDDVLDVADLVNVIGGTNADLLHFPVRVLVI